MKPFYKSVSIALALNFPEAKSADDDSSPLHVQEEADDRPVIVYSGPFLQDKFRIGFEI